MGRIQGDPAMKLDWWPYETDEENGGEWLLLVFLVLVVTLVWY